MQEGILPKEATLVYGTEQISMFDFLQGYKNSAAHVRLGCCKNHSLHRFWDTCHRIRYIRNREQSVSLFITALSMFRTRQASDRRDHMFALLGLGGTIAADYSLSWQKVFMQGTRKLIIDSGELLPLLRTSELERSPELPSWVPDWSAKVDEESLDAELAWLYNWSFFDAAAGTKPMIDGSQSASLLDLQGVRVDRVSEVGSCMDNFSKEERLKCLSEWQDMINKASEDHKHDVPYGRSYIDAFWRSATADIVAEPREDGTVNYRRSVPADGQESHRIWSPSYKGFEVMPSKYLRGFITQAGMIGVGPRDAQVGDEVWVFLGGRMPFVLRPIKLSLEAEETEDYHEYIGQAYVHGIMDGEAMREAQRGDQNLVTRCVLA